MVRSGALATHRSSPTQSNPWMAFSPSPKAWIRSALPSWFSSSTRTTRSPSVSGVGLRYCGPMPIKSLPRRSKAIEQGCRTSGSLANTVTSNPSGTEGNSEASAAASVNCPHAGEAANERQASRRTIENQTLGKEHFIERSSSATIGSDRVANHLRLEFAPRSFLS